MCKPLEYAPQMEGTIVSMLVFDLSRSLRETPGLVEDKWHGEFRLVACVRLCVTISFHKSNIQLILHKYLLGSIFGIGKVELEEKRVSSIRHSSKF